MRFMVGFSYREGVSGEEVQELVPAEQARVKELKEEGILEDLFLAADRSRGWLVMRGESEGEAREAAASLPLSKLWEVEVTPLAQM